MHDTQQDVPNRRTPQVRKEEMPIAAHVRGVAWRGRLPRTDSGCIYMIRTSFLKTPTFLTYTHTTQNLSWLPRETSPRHALERLDTLPRPAVEAGCDRCISRCARSGTRGLLLATLLLLHIHTRCRRSHCHIWAICLKLPDTWRLWWLWRRSSLWNMSASKHRNEGWLTSGTVLVTHASHCDTRTADTCSTM